MLQILLVDDEPYVVDDLAITMPWAELGFEQVHKAYSGIEAMKLLQQHPIDIVITDITMPIMSGLELVEAIRERWKTIKCVLLTGYAEFEYAKAAIRQRASAYLLKPVRDEELIELMEQLHLEIKQEWEEKISYQRSMQTFQEHLPLLHDKLLNDLLQGRRISAERLSEQLSKYNLPFTFGRHASLLAIRLENYFQKHDLHSLQLFEYAIVNIANELFQDDFHLWSCKDVHDYLIFVLQPKRVLSEDAPDEDCQQQLIQTAYQLQKNVNTFIGGGISVVTTAWGAFPDSIYGHYQSAVSIIRQHIGQETGVFLTGSDPDEAGQVGTLQKLYEPPSLFHLFETSNWEAIEEKVLSIVEDLKSGDQHSPEHIQEAKHYLEASFYYFAHKNNRLLEQIIGTPQQDNKLFHTPDMLKDWAMRNLTQIREYFDYIRKDLRSDLIKKAHEYIDQNLDYVSLHSIADHVNLHPVYLSKVYKSETGRRLSDYISQVKMEKAAHLLIHTQLKIYEISTMLGYSNAHYFIKLFREYSQMTPQEFRERSN